MNLPKIGDTRTVGNIGVDLLSSELSNNANVISVPAEKDMGIDLMCELLQAGKPTGMHFYVQCKGTEILKEDFKKTSIEIKVSTLNYWLISRRPVFLILVDIKRNKFYWTYPYDQIKDRLKEIQKKKNVYISVSDEQSFIIGNKQIPNLMKKIIEEFKSDEVMMQIKEMKFGSFYMGDIFELHKRIREFKNQECETLDHVDAAHLCAIQKIREDFNYYFITSEIRVWHNAINQLCFGIFKKTESGKCFYIGNVMIQLKDDGTLDHLIELADRSWLNTQGDIYESFEEIIIYLNDRYKY
ncbi:TPA: DUF4365 domain-containing protein [Bacillus cereus]|nr:DUF4365 domain-containing protein [Bacillus cereus]